MTKPILVSDNIQRLKQNIEDLKTQIEDLEKHAKFNRDEILRLEGCLLVFEGFKSTGIEQITKNGNSGLGCINENDGCHKMNEPRHHEHEHERVHEHEHEVKEAQPFSELYKKYSTTS